LQRLFQIGDAASAAADWPDVEVELAGA